LKPAKHALRWVALVLILGALAWGYVTFDLGKLLTLEHIKASRDALITFYNNKPAFTVLVYLAIYVLAAAASIPGAVLLTLVAGTIFGFGLGLVLVSFASSLGALLAFMVARYVMHDSIQSRFGKSLQSINDGIARDGFFYLLTLRLIPIFPFWLINILMGLTTMSATRFYVASQVGMLPGTAVYVLAGTQLAAIDSLGDILSPTLLASLVLLGAFPLLARLLVNGLAQRKVYSDWQRPAKFDRNLIVIGAGAGGLVTAYIAASVKAKVTLIEVHKMGGDCLNFGCVPSKALIKSAKIAKHIQTAQKFGMDEVSGRVNFAAVMQRVHEIIAKIEPHDSVQRYTDLGVEVLQGHAVISSPWSVEVTLANGQTQTLTTRNIVIATGARPFVPNIPGLSEAGYLTSDNVWNLKTRPTRFVVLGGGPIGCELSQSFARLGSQVTQVEMGPKILSREDPEVSELVTQSLLSDGVQLLTEHKALRVEVVQGEKYLIVQNEGAEKSIAFDEILCAVGRSPRVTGYGLDTLGIKLTSRNTIETNAYLQTRFPNIYAVGDVAGPFQLTHAAAHQAWYAAVNALFGGFKRFKADYSVIPWTTFTDPEVARVGLSESEAQSAGTPYEVTRYDLDDLDRAIADGTAHGFVKVLTVPGKDKILGATIVGEHAGDLLAEFVLAMKHGLGLNKILGTIHTYPTLSEANKYVAGQWRRDHAPQALLKWLEKFHRWQR